MSAMRILIVDDESAFLSAAKKVLEGPGMKVDTVETKAEAEELVKRNRYSAVIADLRLTGSCGEEGLEIARFVRAQSPDTEMMLITAYGSGDVRKKAGELGVGFYFEKPVSIDLLREALRECSAPKRAKTVIDARGGHHE